MALFQVKLNASDGSPNRTTIKSASSDIAITTIFICNTDTSTRTVTLYLIDGSVPGTLSDDNAIWKDISIAAKDTFAMNNERIILASGDVLYGNASVGDKITVTGTFTTI